MKTNNDSQQINAFVDAELDLGSQLEMEERIKTDASLREQVEAVRQLRAAIREGADYHAAPAALRMRLGSLIAVDPAAPSRPSAVAAAVQRWFGWRPLVASFGFVAVAALAVNLAGIRLSPGDRLQDEVVASHVRSTLGQHLVDVASSDHHTVKPWLSSKLDFSPPVNELHLPDCVFVGGRVDYLDGRPVAALVYRKGEHIVNAFVWPTTGKDSNADFSSERGFQTAQWSQGAMTHWVVSDVNREEFKTIVRAVQMADSER